jgi:abortive infection bacteriophage resistance protein
MEIADPERAEFYLRHINYYRLGAYWLPFEADHSTHEFRPGTTFESVLGLYIFDRELRLMVMDAIERFEVSLRSVWAHEMAMRYGPHGHLEASIMRDKQRWRTAVQDAQREVSKSREVFIEHMRSQYKEKLPPVWATCEILTLGALSKWLENLAPMQVRTKIARVYHIHEGVLESWCKHLTIVRNICAHHSRLWNRVFPITPMIPTSRMSRLVDEFERGSRRLYNSLVALLHLMDVIAPDHSWRGVLRVHLQTCVLDLRYMGFPDDWQSRQIWRSAA